MQTSENLPSTQTKKWGPTPPIDPEDRMVRPWGFPTPLSAVVVELDAVAVGVGEIHRDRRPVVLRPTDRIASLHQALDCPGEFTAVGIEDGEVVQSRVPLRWRCAPLTVPGVQAYMVMVVPCGNKRCSWQAEVGSVGGQ